MRSRFTKLRTIAVALPAAAGLALAGCAGAGGGGDSGGGGGGEKSINVLMVGNPQMEDIQQLTADNFTKDTGIKVNYTVLPENELRDKVTPGHRDRGRPVRRRHRRRLRGADLGEEQLAARAAAPTRQGHRASTRPTCSSRWCSHCPARTASSTACPSTASRRSSCTARTSSRARASPCPSVPTWQQVADMAAKVDGAAARHEGHLPARPAWLGRAGRPADHGGEHVRRHLVHQGLAGPGRTAPSSPRRPSSTSTCSGQHGEAGASQAGLHRVPERDEPGQGRDVVRRDLGRRLARGPQGQQGGRQGRLRLRPRGQDQGLRLAVDLGVGDAEDHARRPTTPAKFMLLGVGQGATRSWSARSSAGPGFRPASGRARTRSPSTSRPPPPSGR